MTVISLAHQNIVRSCSAYKKEISQKNKARRFLAISLIFSIITAVFLYVLQVNNIASKDYKIRDLKKEIEKLEDKNRTLQVNISNLKSISVLQTKTETLDMVKAQNIEYVILPLTNIVIAQ